MCKPACVCVCVRYLQLLPGVRQVVYLAVEGCWQLGGAPLQGLSAAQQAGFTALHHHQLSVAALETDRQTAGQTHCHTQDANTLTMTPHAPPTPPSSSQSSTLTYFWFEQREEDQ